MPIAPSVPDAPPPRPPSREEVLHASRPAGDGLTRTDLSVPTIRCGGCIRTIERALGALDGVERARVNLTTKRVSVDWRTKGGLPPLIATLVDIGHAPHLAEAGAGRTDRTLAELVRALAVAGFASGNIMLLSVSVWSGADPAARALFHGISAAIALPVLVYSGRIFFRSAFRALRHGRTNMDVPISIGVLMAFALSLYETVAQGAHAYFEASVMLLFFLLIGRTLEHVMREKARRAVGGLARLVPDVVSVIGADGCAESRPLAEVEPGMTIAVAAGERVPVDGRVLSGASDIDRALVTGESAPQPVRPGSAVEAGTLNLTGPLTIAATAAEGESFLAEMVRLMEHAEDARPAYRRIADRAARLYAPFVHAAALAGFAGWMVASGDLHQAVTVAVAVLIITCPCALGLAAPMVQVVAARRLFEQGVLLKDGAALERLAEIDTVVFDKTGTLTAGTPVLRRDGEATPDRLVMAAAMAAGSRHPLSQALVAAASGMAAPTPDIERVVEHPGCGLEAKAGGDRYRLGHAAWALAGADGGAGADAGDSAGADAAETSDVVTSDGAATETVLARNGRHLATFRFDDPLRPDARAAVAALRDRGLDVHVLSGDREGPVRRLAAALGLDRYRAGVRPGDKVAYLEALAAAGRRVLMVGDGLNDAPALTAAHVSMAPAGAADIGRNAAGLVFLGEGLLAVPAAHALSQRTGRLVRQNFGLAVAYNAVALPFALLGFVTPLVAALAMSLSSITVVANAMRLNGRPARRRRQRTAEPRAAAAIAVVPKPSA